MPRPGLRPEEVAPPGQQFSLRRVGVLADRRGRRGRLPYVWRPMTPHRQFFVDVISLSGLKVFRWLRLCRTVLLRFNFLKFLLSKICPWFTLRQACRERIVRPSTSSGRTVSRRAQGERMLFMVHRSSSIVHRSLFLVAALPHYVLFPLPDDKRWNPFLFSRSSMA